jgi:hypothetical protein
MIPSTKNKDSDLFMAAKYLILEDSDLILAGDEYYNNFNDKWLPVDVDCIDREYYSDESKPIRRKNVLFNQEISNKLFANHDIKTSIENDGHMYMG